MRAHRSAPAFRSTVAASHRVATTTLAGLAFFLAAGCGGGDTLELTPVTGRITLDGEPLQKGTVCFVADSDAGNTVRVNPVSAIKADGAFELMSDGEAGAPVGKYKVTVNVQTMDPETNDVELDPKYASAESTPISIEVVKEPTAGAYDIKIE